MLKIGQPVEFHIARNRFGQYCVPVESLHRPCALTIMRGRVWEAPTLTLIAEHYTGGDIITAGAYFGDFLPFMARLAAPSEATLWAFEPNPVNFLCAGVTRNINALTNCRLIEGGVGAASGQLVMKTHDNNGVPLGGGSRIVAQPGQTPPPKARFETVAIHAIDDVIGTGPVGLVQLDVEGHEVAALRGAQRAIARSRPLLVVEAHDAEALAANPFMVELTQLYGYRQIAAENGNLFFSVA